MPFQLSNPSSGQLTNLQPVVKFKLQSADQGDTPYTELYVSKNRLKTRTLWIMFDTILHPALRLTDMTTMYTIYHRHKMTTIYIRKLSRDVALNPKVTNYKLSVGKVKYLYAACLIVTMSVTNLLKHWG